MITIAHLEPMAQVNEQDYQYHKLDNLSIFLSLRMHSEFIVCNNVGLKTFGISEPVFYDGLVFNSKELLESLLFLNN